MNDGAKAKVPAACLLYGTFGESSGYFQYRTHTGNSQYYLQWLRAVIDAMSTNCARAGGSLTPVIRRPNRRGDTPYGPLPPRLASRDAPGCLPRTGSTRALPPKSETAGAGNSGGFRGQLVRRPMASVVRASALVNSPALARRPRRTGREGGRG